MKNYFFQKDGFALLYTVVVVSLILTIAIGISNTSYKQTILSALARDSQIAFYQADAGVECGLYLDLVQNQFPLGTTAQGATGGGDIIIGGGEDGIAPEEITCGAQRLKIDREKSTTDYFVYNNGTTASSEPCFNLLFDKLTSPGESIVESFGRNMCGPSLRQVERAVSVRY